MQSRQLSIDLWNCTKVPETIETPCERIASHLNFRCGCNCLSDVKCSFVIRSAVFVNDMLCCNDALAMLQTIEQFVQKSSSSTQRYSLRHNVDTLFIIDRPPVIADVISRARQLSLAGIVASERLGVMSSSFASVF